MSARKNTTDQSQEPDGCELSASAGSTSAETFVSDYADSHLCVADDPTGLCDGCPHYRRADHMSDEDTDDWCWITEGKYADGLWHECPAWIHSQNVKILPTCEDVGATKTNDDE